MIPSCAIMADYAFKSFVQRPVPSSAILKKFYNTYRKFYKVLTDEIIKMSWVKTKNVKNNALV